MRVRNVRCCAAVAAALVVSGILAALPRPLLAADQPRTITTGDPARGRELFTRVWQSSDFEDRQNNADQQREGDGLGPVYNDTSCAACHSQGGVGGAGPKEKNAQILVLRRTQGRFDPTRIHPGLRGDGSAVVLHRNSTLQGYEEWRHIRIKLTASGTQEQLIGALLLANTPEGVQDAEFILGIAETVSSEITARDVHAQDFEKSGLKQAPLLLSERNPTALFGAGLIDRISKRAIEDAAQKQQQQSPQIAGRMRRIAESEPGLFGWQAQIRNLREFTLTACAVELGLNVRGHIQASDPHLPGVRASGFDLDSAQCDDLVAFIASLPPPRQVIGSDAADAIHAGQEVFARIGCAQCHLPDLGGVKGLYSDLLLHNMGQQLSGDRDHGYGAFVDSPKVWRRPGGRPVGADGPDTIRKSAFEVRTPPLWGVASSAPYLYDGRAATLADAIAMHGGQGLAAAEAYAALDPSEQESLLKFLGSLVAPLESDVMPQWQPADDPPAANSRPQHPKAAAPAEHDRKKRTSALAEGRKNRRVARP